MNVPVVSNRGMYFVTSLMYVQMIPSPRVGSGVDVRHTATDVVSAAIYRFCRLTFDVFEGKDTQAIKLCAV